MCNYSAKSITYFPLIIFTIEYYGTFLFSKQTVRLIAENKIWPISICLFWEWKRKVKTSQELQNDALRTSHWLSICQVNITKIVPYYYHQYYYHQVWSQLELLSFAPICIEFCQNLCFRVWSQFEF